MTTTTDIIYAAEVFFGEGCNEMDALHAAQDQGFPYYTWNRCSDVFATAEPYYMKGERVCFASALVGPAEQFLAYLAQPERADRVGVLSRVNDEGFFSTTPQRQVAILRELLETGHYCGSGKERFREFMGRAMFTPNPTREVEARLTIPNHWTDAQVRAFGVSVKRLVERHWSPGVVVVNVSVPAKS